MNKLILIVFLLPSMIANSQNNNIVGYWSCHGMVSIDTITHYEPSGYSVDTFYYAIPAIVVFKENGSVNFLANEKSSGTWRQVGNSFSIQVDSWLYSGRMEKDNLLLFDSTNSQGETLHFNRIKPGTTSRIRKSQLLNESFRYTIDSINYTMNFINKRLVVISDGYITIKGRWEIDFFHGFNRLIINDYYMGDHYYIISESDTDGYGGFTFQEHWMNKELPKKQNIKLLATPFLNNSDKKSLKEKIKNEWVNKNDFYPKDTTLCQNEPLLSTVFNFTLDDSRYYYEYVGTGSNSGTQYKITQQGTWSVSETGEYLILSHKVVRNNETIEMQELVTLKIIESNGMTIIKQIDSLSDEHCFYGFTEISLIRK